MKKPYVLLTSSALFLLGACGIIPGTGFYASEVVDSFLNTRFTNTKKPHQNEATRSTYSNEAQGEPWFYRKEPEGQGTRYFFRFYYERCKYSLYVDENDIIRSWRDEGGSDPMNRCLVR